MRIHQSWLFVIFLIVWTFEHNTLPFYFPNLSSTAMRWWGIAGAVGFSLSVLVHEAGHILASHVTMTHSGKRVLFPFGGISEEEKNGHPEKLFIVALSGPLSNALAAAIWYALYLSGNHFSWQPALLIIFYFMTFINITFAGLNLLPAFPLDGGVVLRSSLILWRGDIRKANSITTSIGLTFAIALIVTGVFFVFRGSFFNGLWWVLTGFLLREGISESDTPYHLKTSMEGEIVADYMRKNPVTVPSNSTLYQYVTDFLYRYQAEIYPVTSPDNLPRFITSAHIREIPQQHWHDYRVGDIAELCTETNSVESDADVLKVLQIMSSQSTGRLIVLQNGNLAGIITLKDLLSFFSIKIDLSDTKRKEIIKPVPAVISNIRKPEQVQIND